GEEEAMIGVGKIKQYTNVLDKPLSRGRQEVSFCFPPHLSSILFTVFMLEDAGYAVGARVLELLCHREKFLVLMKGVLDGAGFPAVVTAHFVPVDGQQRPRTTILIKFAEEVSNTFFC
ncbi:hypothetical protein B296_00047396, partial [Ensete ventricosum]